VAKYLFVYHGGSHAETDDEMAAVMDAGFCQQLDLSNWPKLSLCNERLWEWPGWIRLGLFSVHQKQPETGSLALTQQAHVGLMARSLAPSQRCWRLKS
jgi:hypothetical protein